MSVYDHTELERECAQKTSFCGVFRHSMRVTVLLHLGPIFNHTTQVLDRGCAACRFSPPSPDPIPTTSILQGEQHSAPPYGDTRRQRSPVSSVDQLLAPGFSLESPTGVKSKSNRVSRIDGRV